MDIIRDFDMKNLRYKTNTIASFDACDANALNLISGIIFLEIIFVWL